ncbi:TonB-dependent receptor [Povalibacter sp.]|uniref:TonB-dependent receptor n=1 Tax=Povalibacter sp. TaxID=1962978 RepID=UPI002F412605
MHRSILRSAGATKVAKLGLVPASLLAFAVTPINVAVGQEEGSAVTLEVITVTARKKEESIMEIPMAVSALSAEDIDNRGVTNLAQVAQFTPGFFSTNQTAGASNGRNDRSGKQVTFRGLSVSSGLVFIDGAPMTGTATPELQDIAQIEVLKGPQSAYFGRSTFSGAVNFITRDPGEELKGRIRAEAGNYDLVDVSGAIEGAIVPGILTGRVSARHMDQTGQYKNFAEPGETLGDRSTNSGSVTLKFTPTDNLSIRAMGSWVRDDDGAPAQLALKRADMNCDLGGTKGPWFCGNLPDSDKINPQYFSGQYQFNQQARDVLLNNTSNFATIFDPYYKDEAGMKRDSIYSNLRVDYEFDSGYELSALTAYTKEKYQSVLNLSFRDGQDVPNTYGTYTPHIWWLVASQQKTEDFSQEIRLSSPDNRAFRWLVGLSYMEITAPGGSGVYGITPRGPGIVSTPILNESETPAIFGGAYWDVTDRLTLSGELRYQEDTLVRQALVNALGQRVPGVRYESTFYSVSPRFIADFDFTDDHNGYVSWSQGVRPGGFNVAFAVQPPEVQALLPGVGVTFDEEKLTNYEIGLKSRWMDGRAQTRLAVYHSVWEDGQLSNSLTFTPPGGNLNIVGVTANVGKVDLDGVELEAEFQATTNLLLSGSFGYTDSEIKSYICGDCLAIDGSIDSALGKRLPQSSKLTGNLSAEYSDLLFGDYDWFGRADVIYRGDSFVEAGNYAIIPERYLTNVRVGVRGVSGLTVEGYVNNLFDDRTVSNASYGSEALYSFGTGHEVRYAPAEKRRFGVRATYSF